MDVRYLTLNQIPSHHSVRDYRVHYFLQARCLMQQISQSVTHLKPLDLWASAAANAAILPLDLPIEEEKKQNYDPKQFYPVKLGEIFHDKYQVVVKVGFGGHSTVWLARNLHRYVFRFLMSMAASLTCNSIVLRRDILS